MTATKTAPATQTLAARLADAEQAETAPRERANALRASLDAAIASGEYGVADKLKGDLAEARALLALAEAGTIGLRTASASADSEAAAVDRQLAEAQAKAEAQRIIGNGLEGVRRAEAERDAALKRMYEHLAAAASERRAGEAWDFRIGEHQARIVAARVTAGDYPAPGPTPCRPNKTSALSDSDPMVAALARWAR